MIHLSLGHASQKPSSSSHPASRLTIREFSVAFLNVYSLRRWVYCSIWFSNNPLLPLLLNLAQAMNSVKFILNADKHSPASSARSTKRWVRGMLMSVGVESSHWQIAKRLRSWASSEADCECPLYIRQSEKNLSRRRAKIRDRILHMEMKCVL